VSEPRKRRASGPAHRGEDGSRLWAVNDDPTPALSGDACEADAIAAHEEAADDSAEHWNTAE
jgi:hypothetical protein